MGINHYYSINMWGQVYKKTLIHGKGIEQQVKKRKKERGKPKKKLLMNCLVLILVLSLFPGSLPLFTMLNVNLLTFLHWPFAFWKPLMSGPACQERYWHIYTLMALNQNKERPSEPNIYSIYCL